MQNTRLIKLIRNFWVDQSGETAVQTTLIFSAAVILGAVLIVPMLNDSAKEYAYQTKYGIDPIQTSSTRTKKAPAKLYTIRKSVLDNPE